MAYFTHFHIWNENNTNHFQVHSDDLFRSHNGKLKWISILCLSRIVSVQTTCLLMVISSNLKETLFVYFGWQQYNDIIIIVIAAISYYCNCRGGKLFYCLVGCLPHFQLSCTSLSRAAVQQSDKSSKSSSTQKYKW